MQLDILIRYLALLVLAQADVITSYYLDVTNLDGNPGVTNLNVANLDGTNWMLSCLYYMSGLCAALAGVNDVSRCHDVITMSARCHHCHFGFGHGH